MDRTGIEPVVPGVKTETANRNPAHIRVGVRKQKTTAKNWAEVFVTPGASQVTAPQFSK